MRRKYHKHVIGLLIFSWLILSVAYHVIWAYSRLSPLPRLPVPVASRTYLPDPLKLAHISQNVLGAESITGEDIVKYINIERAKVGSPALKINPLLVQAAQIRADTILKHQNFSHQDPYERKELTTVLPQVHYYYHYATENIGMGGDSAESFVGGFMHSTSHRINLQNPQLVETGAAIVTGPYQRWYVNIVVQMFGVPATKEEWLGYSDKDKLYYKSLLDSINGNLAFTNGFLDKRIGDQNYYQSWQTLLLRQQAIIGALYASMMEEVPWRDEQFALIAEYNTNWAKAP
jgi:uncharacterized protein YkwD